VIPTSRARLGLACLAFGASLMSAHSVELDDELPVYEPAPNVSGVVTSIGSDTMNDVMTLWLEGFLRLYPGKVRASIEGRGSATAPPALLHGRATFAPMSRRMTLAERQAFEKKHGYAPTEIAVGLDMLAVFVHEDNPLRSIDLSQVDAIFSTERKGGHAEDVLSWADLGLSGAYGRQPIRLFGRNQASGTHRFFREHALFGGQFKPAVQAQVGGAPIVAQIARDKYAMGYGGIGFLKDGVRSVPLAMAPGAKPIPATAEYAYTGEYPLSRLLFLYIDLEPGTALDPLRAEFLRYVLSKAGQEAILAAGYYPVSASSARSTLKALGLARATQTTRGQPESHAR